MLHNLSPFLKFMPQALVLVLMLGTPASAYTLFRSPGLAPPGKTTLSQWLDSLTPTESPLDMHVMEPLPGTLVPADAASPVIRWRDDAAKLWLVTMTAGSRTVCQGLVDKDAWAPGEELWAAIHQAAGNHAVTVRLAGVAPDGRLVSRGRTSFAVSPDPAGAKIGFLRKRLPFRTAQKNPHDSQVVVGDPASFGRPRVVVEDQPVCFNCHAYSLNGKTYGMDMDYKGDKGAYVLVDVKERTVLTDDDVISWNDYKAPGPAKYSMGLFTCLSPDGRFAASTVGESSAFIMLDDLYFSQMFYPATGQIAVHDRQTGTVAPLPGADDVNLVQTNPSFSPDGSTLAFARAEVRPELVRAIHDGVLRRESPAQSILEANGKYPFRFSLYAVDFNGGKGGRAVPIAGASDNGLSNFFPKYSPDGKWLVFTQCKTGLVLQPDSKLVIVPARGGEPRVLAANTPLMNSWHSWSPNSRWLAFAAKGNSPYTEVYLTHIDENGQSSPALRLFRFSHPELAAMVPEFVPVNSVDQHSMELADPEGAVGKSMATDGR
ncbi:MAG: PD40 domain-containing protein [Desulfovibrionaceae bacterium]|nr:PD40 domain-containing protein [Desulfovibrionaceae bacterium]